MMEGVAFLIVGVALYFLSNLILDRIEHAAGRRFEHRSLIFFALLLGLALASFALIQKITATG